MINKYEKIIFVAGGTGRQGGAVCRHLLKNGWRVRTMTRNASKPSARALIDAGVEVVQGSLNDAAVVGQAVKGVYGVFSVQGLDEGIEAEIRQGCILADIAKEMQVAHFVYNSVGAADRNTGIPFFESKWEIEEHIRGLSMPYTIFRPVFFMDNFLTPQLRSGIVSGTLSLPMKPEKKLKMIAVDDIGAFVAMAFEEPDMWICTTYELAGDEITMPRAAQLFSRTLGREVRFVEMPLSQMRQISEGYGLMYKWFNENDFTADIVKLRSLYPELASFETWLSRANWYQYAAGEAMVSK